MSTFESASTGLERAAREALLILFNEVNDEIAVQEERWQTLDEELADAIGVYKEPIYIENIEPENFYLGHIPSLIEAPIDNYPNIAVISFRAFPSDNDNLDQGPVYDDQLRIEIMVKSPTFDDRDNVNQRTAESIVNSRVQRTADAVNNVILRNQTLNGITTGINNSPSILISDVFSRREKGSHGNKWVWQGAVIEYTLSKYSPFDVDQQVPSLLAGIDQI